MEKQVALVRKYGDINYILYFKGMIREETTGLSAGFGVAICRQEDHNLMFQMKRSLHDSAITVLEAELNALKQGLTKAVHLGITHISIYIDELEIYELVMGSSAPEQHTIALLMDDVQCLRQQFTSSIPVLGPQVKFVYELAMETLFCEITISMPLPTENKTCRICFDDDFEAGQLFCIGVCGHQYCMECVKQYINMRLPEGSVMRCPHYRCETNFTLTNCANLLTPKVREMWERRIKEESIPMADRVYCPYPRCSALMSETQFPRLSKEAEVRRWCFECGKPFCIRCKVPWHSDLSCNDYKRLGPNPTENDMRFKLLANHQLWRQCEKCKHMIELSKGCVKITCRCGHKFCYRCGAADGACNHAHGHEFPPRPPQTSGPLPPPPPPPPPHPCFIICIVSFCILCFVVPFFA